MNDLQRNSVMGRFLEMQNELVNGAIIIVSIFCF